MDSHLNHDRCFGKVYLKFLHICCTICQLLVFLVKEMAVVQAHCEVRNGFTYFCY